MGDDDHSPIEITDADVRAAKRAWLAARDDECSNDDADELLEAYGRLISAQAQQIAEQFRRAHGS